MAFELTGKNYIETMKGDTSFLFVNSVMTVSFFGFGIQALANAVSKIGGDIEWEKGLLFTCLFLICMVAFLDRKDISDSNFTSYKAIGFTAAALMVTFTLGATFIG